MASTALALVLILVATVSATTSAAASTAARRFLYQPLDQATFFPFPPPPWVSTFTLPAIVFPPSFHTTFHTSLISHTVTVLICLSTVLSLLCVAMLVPLYRRYRFSLPPPATPSTSTSTSSTSTSSTSTSIFSKIFYVGTLVSILEPPRPPSVKPPLVPTFYSLPLPPLPRQIYINTPGCSGTKLDGKEIEYL